VAADPALLLEGRRALPVKLHGLGFRFRFHELEDALADLLHGEAVAVAETPGVAPEVRLPAEERGGFAGKAVGA